MRIISGEYRGKKLVTVRSDVRPTTDRVRETLFNIVQGQVRKTVWLDLFAGSGAVGIEAISRGSRYVIFNDRVSTELLRKNLERCQVKEKFEIHQKDALTLFRSLKPPPVDFIFLDPPYKYKRHTKLLTKLSTMPWVTQRSTIVLEVFKKTQVVIPESRLTLSRTVMVGDNKLFFYRVR